MAAKVKPSFVPLEPRTLVVLGALVISMTGVSGLLMLLEPTPLAPIGGPVLTVLDAERSSINAIFDTRPQPDPERWRSIVIHHSGRSYGNAQTLGRRHQRRGYRGLGYHFVIGNGDGAGDGEIQMGYRWLDQRDGRHVRGENADWYNRHAIAICLIGDGQANAPTQAQMDQLVRLVNALQQRLSIPADRVLLRSNLAPDAGRGLLFSSSAFRQQLLDVDAR